MLEIRRRTYGMAGEEFLLIIPAWCPSQYIADGKALSARLADHGFRGNAFGGNRIMCTASGVNVRVPGIPPPFGGIDPALKLHVNVRVVGVDGHRLRANQIFRPASAFHRVLPVGNRMV